MNDFPYLHSEDIGTSPVGFVYSQPVFYYYPQSAENREVVRRRQLIDLGRGETRD